MRRLTCGFLQESGQKLRLCAASQTLQRSRQWAPFPPLAMPERPRRLTADSARFRCPSLRPTRLGSAARVPPHRQPVAPLAGWPLVPGVLQAPSPRRRALPLTRPRARLQAST